MKANEAPEKLWWSEGAVWHTNPNSIRYIEYIRTDAFIEKAATWFANRYQSNGSYLNADDIEDFIKFMKGQKYDK